VIVFVFVFVFVDMWGRLGVYAGSALAALHGSKTLRDDLDDASMTQYTGCF